MQPSADFARVISAESTENSGLRASSDYSLLPKQSDEEQKILDTLIETEELLNKNLCNEMKEALKIYDNCLNDLWHIGEKKAFVAGIKFATKYMIEMSQKGNF